ncbi:hypothetical protein AB0L70_14535 [Kribbella sp. NPDC051952]|uniref:hypothetical protein n=1 Tax=Kribbella sp. NPDC051952 TaxID=3154851 RepID=UPI0034156BC1
MSEAAPEQTFEKQAHALAEKTANAMEMVRNSLRTAADRTRAVDGHLSKIRRDLAELPDQARRMRSSDSPRTHLLDAQSYGDEIHRQLGYAQDALTEVHELMSRANGPLAHAKGFLQELETLEAAETARKAAVQRESDEQTESKPPVTAKSLGERLTKLEATVNVTKNAVEPAIAELQNAANSLQKLRGASVGFEDRQTTSALIDRVGDTVKNDLKQVPATLPNAGPAEAEADRATRAAKDLEKHFKAGLNPTAPAAQKQVTAEDPRVAWSAGKDLTKDRGNLDR